MRLAYAACCIYLYSFAPLTAQSAQPNLDLQHPSIQEIRRLYQEVEQGISMGVIKGQERSVEGCSPFGETRSLFSEVDGHIRKYVLDTGSDDSTLVLRHYYDAIGQLRFVFATGGAVNGSSLEHRIYFDENGMRIREERKFTAGPGYPFASFSDKEGLISKDPRKSYDQSC